MSVFLWHMLHANDLFVVDEGKIKQFSHKNHTMEFKKEISGISDHAKLDIIGKNLAVLTENELSLYDIETLNLSKILPVNASLITHMGKTIVTAHNNILRLGEQSIELDSKVTAITTNDTRHRTGEKVKDKKLYVLDENGDIYIFSKT
jgi:hypothetical protein